MVRARARVWVRVGVFADAFRTGNIFSPGICCNGDGFIPSTIMGAYASTWSRRFRVHRSFGLRLDSSLINGMKLRCVVLNRFALR